MTFQKCVMGILLEKWADLYKWANVGKFWAPVICLAKSPKVFLALCGRKGFMPESLLMEKARKTSKFPTEESSRMDLRV